MADDRLRITLQLDGNGQVTAGLQGVRKGFTDTQASIITLNQGLELLGKAWSAASQGIRLGARFLGDALAASNEQENALKALNQTLVSTGQFTAKYSQQLQDLAGQFQNVTTFGDEAVLGVERLLVSFGAGRDQIERLTRATLDLATGMGIDATSAATLLGKAVAGEFGTLSRYGIIVDENATKAQKLEQALAQIEKRFGGQARAAAETFAGSLAQISNQWGDFLEKVGDAIKQSDFLQDALSAVNAELIALNTSTAKTSDTMAHLANDVLKDLALRAIDTNAVMLAVGDAFQTVGIKIAAFFGVLKMPAGGDAFKRAWADLTGSVTTGSDQMLAKLAELRGRVESFGNDAPKQLGAVAKGVEPITDEAKRAALQVAAIGDNLAAIPTKKDIDINVRQKSTGGGGGQSGGVPRSFPIFGNPLQADANTSSLSTEGFLQFQSGIRDAFGNLIIDASKNRFLNPEPPPPGTPSIRQGDSTLGLGASSLGPGGSAALVEEAQRLGQLTISGPTYEPQMTLSPPVPFSEGVAKMNRMVSEFVARVPPLVFRSNAGDLLRNANPLVQSNLSEAASLAISGTDPAEIATAITSVRQYAQRLRLVADFLSPIQIPFEAMSVRGIRFQDTVEGQANDATRVANALAARLAALLAPQDERLARATERAAAASERTASAISSASFGGGIAKAVESAVRTATGNRGYILTSGRR